ncbi:Rodlet protein [Colletotrichum siamense]|nr:Rodlet protein [Colletotrichum siamense]KAI8189963.1 Rodlet protein [Colletotrichum sp. SAR 10_75]KAI8201230.1 Rodlet protein [Colletotrichum sp. SAR 10_76]KAI8208637.1 Rodlet protein [Colletotrichum sp. SAR 10_65]KAI8223274.1 Rodlet protein [Colletotrichum sp. SAR 10_86]KAI8237464.1 Rodlet protein [Colletotrichum sp. SAR 10_77]KAI8270657.1 Rodlet protein [Colletotrichum sp. SAR11_239]KAJ4996962.1 Rodlet protein [Colletotrichum sp. SAR 10_66]
MRFSAATVSALAMALTVAAAPGNTAKEALAKRTDDLTVADAQNICGKDLSVNCCNQVDASTNNNDNSGAGILSGILGGVLGNGGLKLTDGCSSIGVGIANDLLNSQCKQSVACCKTDGNTASGLVAVQLPCIPISGLL